jgi:hypothetical protein
VEGKRNAYRNLVGISEERDHLEELNECGTIILKRVVKE